MHLQKPALSSASLRRRLLLLVLIVVLPYFALLTYNANVQRIEETNKAQDQALRLALAASLDQENRMEQARQLLAALSLLPEARNPASGQCAPLLSKMQAEFPGYNNLFISDTSGKTICSAIPLSDQEREIVRPYVRDAAQNRQFTIGTYERDRTTGAQSVGFASPIRNDHGQVQGVITALLDLKWLGRFATKDGLPPGTSLVVLDSNSVVLAQIPQSGNWVGQSVADNPAIRSIIWKGSGVSQGKGLDGVEMIFGFSQTLGPEGVGAFVLTVGIPKASIVSAIDSALLRNILLLILAGILTVALAWVGSEVFILKQVRTLVGTTERLIAGDLSARTDLGDGMGELEQVGRTLDRLAERLQERDVERDQAEAELESRVAIRTNELSEANAELEAFSYSVSHDLRAPLRAISGYMTAILQETADEKNSEVPFYARRALDASSRMDQLIKDVLAYNRLSRAEIVPKTNELSEIVRAAVLSLDSEIKASDANIKVGPLPYSVFGHRSTLVLVCENLLANALKFVPRGQKPRIRIGARSGENPDTVRLWIDDNGIGIAPEHYERIFIAFERLHGIEEYPGTGIGLALVRRAIERMNGRLGLESEPGSGSTFWIELPAAPRSEEVNERPIHSEPKARGENGHVTTNGHKIEYNGYNTEYQVVFASKLPKNAISFPKEYNRE